MAKPSVYDRWRENTATKSSKPKTYSYVCINHFNDDSKLVKEYQEIKSIFITSDFILKNSAHSGVLCVSV